MGVKGWLTVLVLLGGTSVASGSARADVPDPSIAVVEPAELPAPADVQQGNEADAALLGQPPVHAATAGSATEDALELEFDDRPTSFPDPFEGLNRRTLSLNQTVDRWLVSPVSGAYGYVVPDRAKRSVRDFFDNLESPAIFVNDLLQGEVGGAATTVARFSVNTVFGLAGLFDPASAIGLERHQADFGQTLARTGIGSGPFLIVPLLGPTTVRDGIGALVDVALQPMIYLLGPAPLFVASVQGGTEGLTLREQHGDDMKRLEQGSLDYYAALRSAYYQNRIASLGEGPVSDGAANVDTSGAEATAVAPDAAQPEAAQDPQEPR